ncbi:MAG: glycosyltransferase [Actinomycetaceae bacterium]|nr:glycosyltransferase [Actinomycetaceae bacterium]
MAKVSVILVNYRGADDSIAAARYIRQCEWKPEDLEIVVVDNNSGDGSYEKLCEELPDCLVVQSGANRGFAGGCNFGVAQSSGDIVAFLNNDARPHEQWISEAVRALESDPKIGCVASKVLDWDGENIDYVDASVTWFGMGYKRWTLDKDAGLWDSPKNVLFPTGAAMFVPRSIYDELEGFDERFFMFYEDLDFGFRLNLAGYDVRYVPTSIAYHRHHATMDKHADQSREFFLLERNALMCMYKNYSADLLRTAFVPALMLSLKRSQACAQEKLDEDSAISWQTTDAALTSPYACASFVDMLPSLTQSRAAIQQTRKKSDAEILELMGETFEPLRDQDSYVVAHGEIADYFHVNQTFPTQTRILIVTGDFLGEKMAGPAIRAWQMAKHLSKEHRVFLGTTNPNCEETVKDVEADGFDVLSLANSSMLRANTDWADVVIFQGFLLEHAPWLMDDQDTIVVADIYNPMHLEQLEQGRDLGPQGRQGMLHNATVALNQQIERADYFLCASEKQRQFWLGQLASCGRLNQLSLAGLEPESLIGICPFGLDEELPVQTEHAIRGSVPGIGMDDKLIIWGGGVYNWFDPITLVHAVDALKDKHPDVRLYFLGLKNPNPDVPDMKVAAQTVALSSELGLTGRFVFFNHDWVPYNERQNYLLDANVGVSTHFEHVETQFSFRTRILDYLWAGLPIVATEGDSFGNVLDSEGIGISVKQRDVEGLAAALEVLLYDEARAQECRKNVERFAQRFRWSKTLAPLIDFCSDPRQARDIKG